MAVSKVHEVLVELFRQRPALAGDLLRGPLQLDLPPYDEARLESGDATEVVPVQFRADAVVTLGSGQGRPELAVIVEVQLRPDRDKPWVWPAYVAMLRARMRCPTILLVVTPEPVVARWAALPIALGGPASFVVPIVLGPDLLPEPEEGGLLSAPLDLIVLSAIAHDRDPAPPGLLQSLAAALATADPEAAATYTDLVAMALRAASWAYLEDLMTATYEYKSDFARKYVEQGREEGREEGRREQSARLALALLESRGVPVDETSRARITGCTDLDRLSAWVLRAATARRVEDLFA